MIADVAATAPQRTSGMLRRALGGVVKFVVLVLFCLNPLTAILALGWLTEKTARDVGQLRVAGRSAPWPCFIRLRDVPPGLNPIRLISGLVRGGIHYGVLGIKAWIAVLVLLLPFELVWLAGWFAGWENSFSKGYELSGIWPGVSLAAVFLSLPILFLAPMAIAHQAVSGRIFSVFELGTILSLSRAVAWRYLWLTVLIAVGWVSVFAVRGLPVFAEQYSPLIVSGEPEAIERFMVFFKLSSTGLLIAGLLVIRRVTAGAYARAEANVEAARRGGWIKTIIVALLGLGIWLGLVFLVYFGQFLNYSWWSWINQPVIMLPWLGVLP